jgi:hypothetical protein
MKMKPLLIIGVLILSISFMTPPSLALAARQTPAPQNALPAEKFRRTELYFGMNKHDGTVVTEEEWSKFLADEVTSRFPEGFTVLEGYGQFKNASGKIVKEKSRVLILLYPKRSRKDADQKIEEIRKAYTTIFKQESVLRMDIVQTVRVSF